jgi:hypothetical protein
MRDRRTVVPESSRFGVHSARHATMTDDESVDNLWV